MPDETRTTGADAVEQVLTAPITRVDAEQRLVTVTATSESVDSYSTPFAYEASKDAFMRWIGNVREMHECRAVGARVGVRFDDAERRVYVLSLDAWIPSSTLNSPLDFLMIRPSISHHPCALVARMIPCN
jgi:hypothetical protein